MSFLSSQQGLFLSDFVACISNIFDDVLWDIFLKDKG